MKGDEIEERSMQIIEEEIGSSKLNYSSDEWLIVRRVIHATADFDYARSRQDSIVFSKNAIASALLAIENRYNIVCDTDIIPAALNSNAVRTLGLKCITKISDPLIVEEARRSNRTRAEVAMRAMQDHISDGGGIVAVGNAPTALYELIRMVRDGDVKPNLVIALPVGFVSAVESKIAFISTAEEYGIEYISNRGRKGGSTVVASILNALFKLYIQKKSL
ncbi:MAG: precorrin-8X methylmutase [Candidatus Nitrosocaldus sp.]